MTSAEVARETPLVRAGLSNDGKLFIIHDTPGENIPSNTKVSDHHRDIRAFVVSQNNVPVLYLEEANDRKTFAVRGKDILPERESLKWVGPTTLTFVSTNTDGSFERYVFDVRRLTDESEKLSERPQFEDLRPIVDAVF
jgi:hypothetical protein